MMWLNKFFILLVTVCSFSVNAAINVSLHQDLELLVLKEKNVGFTVFDNNEFTLENGQNQIVVRVSKLVIKQGQKEKFKSEPIVVSFDLNDTDLVLFPTRLFMRSEEIKGFDKAPVLDAKSAGQTIVVEQSLLERGVGMTRDYAAELKMHNQPNSITPVVNKNVQKTTSSPIKMSQDLFVKASAAEKEQFTDWAFKNRKAIKSPLNGEGKILPMLEYWYEKASEDEKATILTWVLAQ